MELVVQELAESELHSHDLAGRHLEKSGKVSEIDQLFRFKLELAGEGDAGCDYSIERL